MSNDNSYEDDIELQEDDHDDSDSTSREVRLDITVDKGQELIRIDKYLFNRIENATRSKVQQALEDGHILVNDAIVKSNYKVRPNDHIVVFETREAHPTEVVPEQIHLNIVYEDDHLLVINKPAGMVVHPANGNYSGTLVNGLAYYLNSNNIDTTDLKRVGLIHRIDKDTSGLLVIGKTEQAISKLSAQFKAHTVYRRYIALVWGDFEEDEGTIHAHIGRNQRFRKKMDAYPDGEHGKEAITHYKVLERFNYVSLLELRLETGRTHQIRVHMKHIGHPLFNDMTYGGDSIVKGTIFSKYKQFIDNCFKTIPRQALHAKELGFIHPETGEKMNFDSDLPEDFKGVLNKWESYTNGLNKQTKRQL